MEILCINSQILKALSRRKGIDFFFIVKLNLKQFSTPILMFEHLLFAIYIYTRWKAQLLGNVFIYFHRQYGAFTVDYLLYCHAIPVDRCTKFNIVLFASIFIEWVRIKNDKNNHRKVFFYMVYARRVFLSKTPRKSFYGSQKIMKKNLSIGCNIKLY